MRHIGPGFASEQASPTSDNWLPRVLNPMDRISEVLFGVIMVLTFTASLSAAEGDRLQIHSVIVGALGCNLAWGVIDGAIYLLAQLNERGRNIRLLRAVREAPDTAAAQGIIADSLPPLLASLLPSEQLELLRRKLGELPEPIVRARLTGRDALGAAGVFLLVFFCTFPVVIPLMLIADPRLARFASNAVAIAMLFLCGYAFGRHAGVRPWASGLAMVVIGAALAGFASVLGG